MKKKLSLKMAIVVLLVALALPSFAQSYYVTNGAGTNWSMVSNWDYFNGISMSTAAALPGVADSVVVNHTITKYSDSVQVKNITINAGGYLTSYTPILPQAMSGNGITINSGGFLKNYNSILSPSASSTLLMHINAGGTYIVNGGIDSTVHINNYGEILFNYGGSLQQDGVINNYKRLLWTSSQGVYSSYKRGVINNFDSIMFTPSGSTHVYFQDQKIINNTSGTMVIAGSSNFLYLDNSFNVLPDTATFINYGSVYLNNITRWVLACKTNNYGTINVGNHSEAYFSYIQNHYFEAGSVVTGQGTTALYGNKYCTGSNQSVNVSTDTVLLGIGTLYGPDTLAVNSNYFKYDGDIASNGVVHNLASSRCDIAGATVKSIAGQLVNFGKLNYSSTNIDGGGQVINMDTMMFLPTNGSGYLAIGNITFSNEAIAIFDCGSSEYYYQSDANAHFINDANAKLFAIDSSQIDFGNGFFTCNGKAYIEAGSKIRFLNNVTGNIKCDTLFADGSIDCFGNGKAKFSNTNGTQYISNWTGNATIMIGNLEISNSANVEMLAAVKCSKLELTSGKLILNSNNFFIEDAANITGYGPMQYLVTNDTGIVNTKVNYFGNAILPIGTSAKYAPLYIANYTSVAPYYEYFASRVSDSVYYNYAYDVPQGNAILQNAINSTFYVSNTTALGIAIAPSNNNLTVKIEPGFSYADTLANFDMNNTRVSHYIGGAWVHNALGVTSYDATMQAMHTTATNDYTSLSPFTVSTGPLSLCSTITVYDTITACVSTGYTWHGNTYFAAGNFVDSFITANGCDSIKFTNLNMYQLPASQSLSGNHTICPNTNAFVTLAASQKNVRYVLQDSSTGAFVSACKMGTDSSITLVSSAISSNTTLQVHAASNQEQSYAFDGFDDIMTAPISLDANDGTWEAWVNKNNWAAFNDDRLFGNDIDFTSSNSFYLSLHPSVGIHFRYGGVGQAGNGAAYPGTIASFTNNSWHHIACTWHLNSTGQKELSVYADGVLVASTQVTASINIGNTIFFGGSYGTPRFGAGKMDEIRLWNYAKTGSQIAADRFNCAPDTSGLLLQYQMQDVQGSFIVSDASPRNNNGTLITYSAGTTYSNQSPLACSMPDSICGAIVMPQTFAINIQPAIRDTFTQNVCPASLPFIWNGNAINAAAGTENYVDTTYVNAAGCDSIVTLKLIVWNVLSVVATTSLDSICAGDSTILIAYAQELGAPIAASFAWAPSASLVQPNNDSTVAVIISNTIYTVTATAANGCTATQTLSMNALPLPIINASTATPNTICAGKPTVLSINASGNDSITVYSSARESVYVPTTIQGSSSSGTIKATKFFLGTTAIVDSLWLDAGAAFSGTYKLAVYSDSAGAPKLLLAQTNSYTNANTGINIQPTISTISLTAGTYWVALINDSDMMLRSNFSGANSRSALSFYAYNGSMPTTTSWVVLAGSNAYGLGVSVQYPSQIAAPPSVQWVVNNISVNKNFIIDFPAVNTIYTATVTSGRGCTITSTISVNVNATTLAMQHTASTQKHLNFEMVQEYIDSNCNLICGVLDIAKPSIFDSIAAEVFVDTTQIFTHNNQPYVSRYWHITPKTNGNAKVYLYLTQADFDLYNLNCGNWPKLPTSDTNIAGIANVRVTKVSGGALGSTGTVATVIPITKIFWDSVRNFWELEVQVDSFSYFFVHGVNPNNTPLSIGLNLQAKIAGHADILTWQASNVSEVNYFEIQEQQQGVFRTIAVQYSSPSTFAYLYSNKNYSSSIYRIVANTFANEKVVSNVIALARANNNAMAIYPNPTSNVLNLDINAASNFMATIKIFDLAGKLVHQIETNVEKGHNLSSIDVAHLANGIYVVKAYNGNMWLAEQLLKKE